MIRVSRIPFRVGGAFVLAGVVQAGWLLHEAALLPAASVLLGVCAIGWGMWGLLRGPGALPCVLCLLPGGRARIHAPDIEVEARLEPCSLRLGRYALLVLRGHDKRRLRLLLGPEILSAQDCAALGRWLAGAWQGGNEGEGTAVD